ncbi:MAG TPA: hypothetical protein PKU70_12440 [Vicinamibacteria bacterium]|nr:hypothetical protein [Vicinamibacteria bacterium]HRB13810.1 hypothetical protein [Vicinamibacteria bacterium]
MVSVALHGWLNEEMLGEFERECEPLGARVWLDLSQLVGADEAGLRALNRRAAAGIRLVGTSPYIQLLLKSQAAADAVMPPGRPASGPVRG